MNHDSLKTIIREIRKSTADLAGELENLQEIAQYLNPSSGDLPELSGIDVYGQTLPLNGMIGGDHIIYIDFKKRYDLDARIQRAREQNRPEIVENLDRCRQKAGIVLADVSGHWITDALVAGMLHQALLLGAIYELDYFGDITTRLFENLNTRFYQSSSVRKFLTMIYGEILEDGTFRFISAGHPPPIVFSCDFDKIVNISPETLTTFPPIGTMPSDENIDRRTTRSPLGFKERYEVNQLNLMGDGDILLLYSDGLSEHGQGGEAYFPRHLEDRLRQAKDLSAREIFQTIEADLLSFSRPCDDLSFVVIKRTI